MLSCLRVFQPLVICQLQRRSLLKITGRDTLSFLQGMITNDVNLLNPSGSVGESEMKPNSRTYTGSVVEGHESRAIYAMYLNPKGRVVCDLIVYKAHSPEDVWADFLSESLSVYIELDTDLAKPFLEELNRFKINKQVNPIAVTDKAVFAAFSVNGGKSSPASPTDNQPESQPEPEGQPGGKWESEPGGEKCVYPDPRLPQLGHRLLLPTDSLQRLSDQGFQCEPEEAYKDVRHALGVGEGPEDHPTGKALPLECNLADLHGVSFHKGCYIGQELTARTFHTGVIRKRLMPVELADSSLLTLEERERGGPAIPPRAPVVTQKGDKVGVLRDGLARGRGLALLNVKAALEAPAPLLVKINGDKAVAVNTKIPDFWNLDPPTS